MEDRRSFSEHVQTMVSNLIKSIHGVYLNDFILRYDLM